jgi:type II secretory pathway predicted ATPase ExeA
MNKKLLTQFGLKFHPFHPDVPSEALQPTPRLQQFSWRVEQQIKDGGFALVTGEPGSGKSVAMRLLLDRLSRMRDATVGVLGFPQGGLADFYRELGDIFGVSLTPRNRWGGAKVLREKWHAHIESTLLRPILLIDEAQEMQPVVLSELRLLSSTHFDSRILLTVVLAGDGRLTEKLRSDELLPLGSRIRSRLVLEHATPKELCDCLEHLLDAAGNPRLMSKDLMTTLSEHAAGNYRLLCNLASELLAAGAERDVKQLDDKLYLEVFAAPPDSPQPKQKQKSR